MKDYNKRLEELYKPFMETITEYSEDAMIEEAAHLYEDINKLNINYHQLNNNVFVDDISIYFIICRIMDAGYQKTHYADLDSNALEKQKMFLASRLATAIMESKMRKIVIIEPHHDDALGSASSFVFDRQNLVTVYTMCESGDDRDRIKLSDVERTSNIKSTHRKTAVRRHISCGLADYHYNRCYEFAVGGDVSYSELIEYYLKNESRESGLCARIKEIFEQEKDNCAYYIIPLGLKHPMHVLMAYYAVQQALATEQGDKIIFYVDHPYDMEVTIMRIAQAQAYYEGMLGVQNPYVRMDSAEINQREIGILVKEIYNDKHYGEFHGTLEKTCCSYLVPAGTAESLAATYHLHINNILFATYQAKPFLKSGGLGEVAYTYTSELSRHVNKVAIITPKQSKYFKNLRYPLVTCIDGVYYSLTVSEDGTFTPGEVTEKTEDSIELLEYNRLEYPDFSVELSKQKYDCNIEKYLWHDVHYYLVSIKGFFNSDNMFDNENISSEIAAFSMAVIESIKGALDFVPTVIHCNDYQTALIPFLLKYRYLAIYEKMRTVYTIHYYGYKGIYSKSKLLKVLNIDQDTCDNCMICNRDSNESCIFRVMSPYSQEDMNKLGIKDDKVSLMKIGICFADVVTTVSEGYARQLSDYQDIKKATTVHGIRNGIVIPDRTYMSGNEVYMRLNGVRYASVSDNGKDTLLYAKKFNKRLFQKEAGLTVDDSIPLLCMVSRLNSVKGVEDIKNIFDKLMQLDLQLVIIGDDDKNVTIADSNGEGADAGKNFYTPYATLFSQKEKVFKGKFKYYPFAEDLEFKAYLAGDILIMPSREEACGTTQMLAMKHGVIPIVSMIPAFEDTVVDYAQTVPDRDSEAYVSKPSFDKGVGFYTFRDDCWILLDVIHGVVEKYRNDKEKWVRVMNSTQPVDFSWNNNSLVKYLQIYNSLEIR